MKFFPLQILPLLYEKRSYIHKTSSDIFTKNLATLNDALLYPLKSIYRGSLIRISSTSLLGPLWRKYFTEICRRRFQYLHLPRSVIGAENFFEHFCKMGVVVRGATIHMIMMMIPATADFSIFGITLIRNLLEIDRPIFWSIHMIPIFHWACAIHSWCYLKNLVAKDDFGHFKTN